MLARRILAAFAIVTGFVSISVAIDLPDFDTPLSSSDLEMPDFQPAESSSAFHPIEMTSEAANRSDAIRGTNDAIRGTNDAIRGTGRDIRATDMPRETDAPEKAESPPANAINALGAGNSDSPNEDSDNGNSVVAKKIPTELNRDLRVGVIVDAKSLYILRDGEPIHVTPIQDKLKFQGQSELLMTEDREIYSDGGCIALAEEPRQLQSACYPGYFALSARHGKITAINILDVEEYLRGVVPYEIGKLDSSRFEALKSQAVAARTYVYKHMGSRESQGFDVYADTRDQVYKGLQSATPLTDAAVRETEGIVMTYGGNFITAYYHSTCGGKTESLATWGRPDTPYLKSRPDLRKNGTPWCIESSYSSWERRFTREELTELFFKNAKEAKVQTPRFNKVRSVKTKETLPSGRVLSLEIVTDKGSFRVKGDKTRWLFKKNGSILPSSYFQLRKEKGQLVIRGKGFGHGVGMCQMGARARAQAGQSYVQILTHYYPGITLEKFER